MGFKHLGPCGLFITTYGWYLGDILQVGAALLADIKNFAKCHTLEQAVNAGIVAVNCRLQTKLPLEPQGQLGQQSQRRTVDSLCVAEINQYTLKTGIFEHVFEIVVYRSAQVYPYISIQLEDIDAIVLRRQYLPHRHFKLPCR